MNRRDLLAIATVGPLAMAGFAAQAKSPALTAREQANIDMVKKFLKSLEEKPFDIEKLVQAYFDPNATVRWADNMPAAIGAQAAIEAAKNVMSAGSWVEVQTFDIFARGPLVATSRIDTLKVPGQPDTEFAIAGLHIIKDGKFIEYTDYVFT